jgi:restriction system protein
MGRRSKNETPPEILLEILAAIFQVVPPWICIPVGLIGFVVIAAIWCSIVKIPQLQYIGLIFGAGFALISFVAGWKGVQFRQRQRVFLGAEIDLDWVRGLSWRDFERQLASVYRQNGYQVEETGGGGPDGGVDLKLFKGGRTTVVQCKHWKTWKVNVRPVRELLGVMTAERAHAAIFIASGHYTADAVRFAEGKPIELIDRDGFLVLVRQFQRDLQKHYGYESRAGATTSRSPQSKAPSRTPLAAVVTSSVRIPECPVCQSPMKLRTAKKGGSVGSQFWGCIRFPKCRGTQNC